MPSSPSPRLQKAVDLLRLVRMLVSSRYGAGYDEIEEEFNVSRRTAERMVAAVCDLYPDYVAKTDGDRCTRWQIPQQKHIAWDPFQTSDIAAIETAAATLEQTGLVEQAQTLRDLGLKIRAALPDKLARHADVEYELLTLSESLIQRPGPRVCLAEGLVRALRNAIIGPNPVSFTYASRIKGDVTQRTVEPYGFIYGPRPYLLARTLGGETADFRLFSLSDISNLEVADEQFVRDEAFSLSQYVEQSFGAYQEPVRNVVWRVAPEAADEARTWIFHPSQSLEDKCDGSLLVRFRAGGLREMCWHLFTWGGAIEVLEPPELKAELAANLARFGRESGERQW